MDELNEQRMADLFRIWTENGRPTSAKFHIPSNGMTMGRDVRILLAQKEHMKQFVWSLCVTDHETHSGYAEV